MTSRQSRNCDPCDSALFRAVVSDVQPLAADGRIASQSPALRPLRRRITETLPTVHDRLSDGLFGDDPEVPDGDAPAFLRSGMQRDTLRRLRRGHWAIQAELDLHGMVRDEARLAVAGFLARSVRQGQRCVRIIHGKGLGSSHRRPVLRGLVAHWLVQCDEVLACCQARQADGGSGAVVILLKSGVAR